MAASALSALLKPKNPTYGGNMADLQASAYGNLGGATTGGTGAATTPSTTPSPLKTITLGGGAPDFAFNIDTDPAYKQLKDSLSAAGISDAAHLRGAIQQALIQFGAVPDLPSGVLQTTGLDTAGTQALADNNPFSTLKRLQQQYQDSQDSTKNQLASRGILSSGETGYQLGKLGQQQAGAQYDATNSLLGSIGSLNDQFAAGRQAAASQLAQGAFTAESSAAASGAGAAPSAGVTATWDPTTGLYKDPSGSFYDQSGNPVSFNQSQGGISGLTAPAAQDTYTPSAALGSGATTRTTRFGV